MVSLSIGGPSTTSNSSAASSSSAMSPSAASSSDELRSPPPTSRAHPRPAGHSSSRAARAAKLSVVIPSEQKTLVTPTLIPDSTTAAHQLFHGAVSSLFTGLPSCTPTSADQIPVSMNPFFWGVSSAGHPFQASAANSPHAEPQAPAREQAPELDCPATTRLMDSLQPSQPEHQVPSASLVSFAPFSFWPISPEADRFLRLGLKLSPRAHAHANAYGRGQARPQDLTSATAVIKQQPLLSAHSQPDSSLQATTQTSDIGRHPRANPPIGCHSLESGDQPSQFGNYRTQIERQFSANSSARIQAPPSQSVASDSRLRPEANTGSDFQEPTNQQQRHPSHCHHDQSNLQIPVLASMHQTQATSANRPTPEYPIPATQIQPDFQAQFGSSFLLNEPPVCLPSFTLHHTHHNHHQQQAGACHTTAPNSDSTPAELAQQRADSEPLAAHDPRSSPSKRVHAPLLFETQARVPVYKLGAQTHQPPPTIVIGPPDLNASSANHHHYKFALQSARAPAPQAQLLVSTPLPANSGLPCSPASSPNQNTSLRAPNPQIATTTPGWLLEVSQQETTSGQESSSAVSLDAGARCSFQSQLTTSGQQQQAKNAKTPTPSQKSAREVANSNASVPATLIKRKSKGGRKKKQVTAEELVARKNRSKERNRVAAKRCRQKRKVFLGELNQKIQKLQEENKSMKKELDAMRQHHRMCNLST